MLRRQVSDWRERAGCLKGVAPWKCPLLHPPDLCQRFLVANASRLPAPHAGPGDVPEAGWPRGLGVWLPGVAWGGGMAGLHVAQGAHGGGGPGSNCVAKPLQHGCSEAIPGDLLGPLIRGCCSKRPVDAVQQGAHGEALGQAGRRMHR